MHKTHFLKWQEATIFENDFRKFSQLLFVSLQTEAGMHVRNSSKLSTQQFYLNRKQNIINHLHDN